MLYFVNDLPVDISYTPAPQPGLKHSLIFKSFENFRNPVAYPHRFKIVTFTNDDLLPVDAEITAFAERIMRQLKPTAKIEFAMTQDDTFVDEEGKIH